MELKRINVLISERAVGTCNEIQHHDCQQLHEDSQLGTSSGIDEHKFQIPAHRPAALRQIYLLQNT